MEFHATIHGDDDGSYWAQVKELPGCFASGHTLDELQDALIEAIETCLERDPASARTDVGTPRVDELKLVTA